MAEIVLVTGTPGTGKTLKVVSMMATDPMFKPDENGISRKVFTNIKGLKIDHVYVESDKEKLPKSTDTELSFHDIHEWIRKPENQGSIVIVDEAQDVWPARTSGSQIPKNVAWLNTHRHLGIDIFVITQNPKNLDINLRGLVKKHWHIAMNKLGMRTLLEWKYCADNPLQNAKSAFSSIYKLDESVYSLYKSAEVHTVNKVRKSRWVYVLPVVLVLMPLMIGVAWYMLKSYGKTGAEAEGDASVAAASAPVASAASAAGSFADYAGGRDANLTAEMFVPTLAEKPESKPIYNGVRQVKAYERIAACISGGKTSCTCYSDQATPLKEVTKEMCQKYAKEGLPFNPYKDASQTAQNAPVTPDTGTAGGNPSRVAVMGGVAPPDLSHSGVIGSANIGGGGIGGGG